MGQLMIRKHSPRDTRLDHWKDYGGSGGPPAGRYFYLIVKSNQTKGALKPGDIQKFVRSGVATSEDYAFTLVDIATDHRLRDDVLKIKNGQAFYERLDAKVPAFLITLAPISKIADADTIRLHPVGDYDESINIIYSEMGLLPLTVRRGFINSLKKVNSYLHLKPNFLGVGANFNEMITDLIARLERTTP
jgi:hypothetical protein